MPAPFLQVNAFMTEGQYAFPSSTGLTITNEGTDTITFNFDASVGSGGAVTLNPGEVTTGTCTTLHFKANSGIQPFKLQPSNVGGGGGSGSASSTATPKRIFVASRSYHPDQGKYTTSGTALSFTYRLQHKMLVPCFDVSFIYGNYSQQTAGANAITVTASIEVGGNGTTSGTLYPLTFNGQTSVTIQPGTNVVSDPLALNFNQGDAIFSRTCVSVSTAGYTWPIGATSTLTGEGMTSGDITQSGTPTTTSNYCYSPFAIVGSVKQSYPSVLLVGDSIMSGWNTNAGVSGVEQALISANIPYAKIAHGGETAGSFSNELNSYYRLFMAKFATHAICNYGVNDMKTTAVTLANMQSNLPSVWTALNNMGLKVFQTTITPYTNSTDSWATLANQSAYGPNFGGTNSGTSLGTCERTQVNDWIRTTPSPLTGYFETADTVESARNSGLWRVDINVTNGGGGVHPSQLGYNQIQAAIDTTKIHL